MGSYERSSRGNCWCSTLCFAVPTSTAYTPHRYERMATSGRSSSNTVGPLRPRGASVDYSVSIAACGRHGKKGNAVVEAQPCSRAFTAAAQLRRSLVGILSLAAIVFGLVAMHAGMAAESEASPHSHAMSDAQSNVSVLSAGGSDFELPFASISSASASGTSHLPSTCLGMCAVDCLMTGSACTAGLIAHSPNPVAQHAITLVVPRSAVRAAPTLPLRLPPQRPPSLTALSISRV
ncbi:DUF6153 family protein [Cryobacterium sp. RTS3]|uniref:DUF6153 family protein n=2 Tax=unclassified Cryobacterium TaxID=2649013 RepID=UPI0034DD17DE